MFGAADTYTSRGVESNLNTVAPKGLSRQSWRMDYKTYIFYFNPHRVARCAHVAEGLFAKAVQGCSQWQ